MTNIFSQNSLDPTTVAAILMFFPEENESSFDKLVAKVKGSVIYKR